MTAVEFQTEQIGILVSKLFNDEISKAEFHFQRFEICEQAKEMEKQHIFDARLKGIFEGIDYEQKQNSVLQQFKNK
jgi:hypothetical protein